MADQVFLSVVSAHALMRRSLGLGADIPIGFIQHDERTFTVERLDGENISPREGKSIQFILPIPVENGNIHGAGHG